MATTPDDTTQHHFWIGIHEVYPKSIWGYRSDGVEYITYAPFLVWGGNTNDNSRCVDVREDAVIWKTPCNTKREYICEAGIYEYISFK